MRLLVIGYGNELRGDDGVGPAVAREVVAWGLPGVEAIAAHQLAPEFAERVSKASGVIFVDACEGVGDVGLAEVVPSAAPRLGHVSGPGWVLAFTLALTGSSPPAWLLTVPVEDFGFHIGLSPSAERGVQAALRMIRDIAIGGAACTRSA